MVHTGLAADAGIDHRQQRGGDLDKRNAAQHGGGGETGHVTDDAAAEREQGSATLDFSRKDCVIHRQ